MAETVFGIDLGTTYSAIANINDLGQPEVILNREGDYTTPSVVFFETDTNYVVGKEAKNGAVVNRDNTVSLIKRHMGTDLTYSFFGQSYRPETISAVILKDLVEYARETTGIDSSKVVITVPAYFGLAEKEATRQAGVIAGLDVVGIVTEPVAAALSVGIKGEEPKTLFVYDLGGGTFDCTIMKVSKERVSVVVIDGNRRLGGADWDAALFDLVAEKFKAQAGLSEDPTEDEDFAQRLLTEVEACKKTLSRREKASIALSHGDVREMVEITREEFEQATASLVDQTIMIVQRTLESARAKEPGLVLDEVLLVGGSGRMPMIKTSLIDRLGWTVRETELDLAVAKGAAIYGQGDPLPEPVIDVDPEDSEPGVKPAEQPEKVIQIGGSTVTITNVLSRSIGVKFIRDTPGGTNEEYIGFLAHANESLPLEAAMEAATYLDGQTQVEIHIFEQNGERESELISDNREVTPDGGAVITGLPRLPKGSPIHFSLSINSEGLSSLSAYEPATNQQLKISVNLSVMQKEDVEVAAGLVSGLSRRDD